MKLIPNFEVAQGLADTACFLDGVKNELASPHDREMATLRVKLLHDLAQRLAGDRVDEIYAKDDEPAEPDAAALLDAIHTNEVPA